MVIEVVRAGLQDLVQDEGRHGYYHLGLPPSGAMDLFSHRVANLLVGNLPSAATLEFTYLGPTLRAGSDVTASITGAQMRATLDGAPVENWRSFHWPAGAELAFSAVSSGARGYLAVSGGIDVPLQLGSRSNYVIAGIGGLHGRKLAPGDSVPVGIPDRPALAGRALPPGYLPTDSEAGELRFTDGIHAHRLATASAAAFASSEWTVTVNADRVGYRLRGDPLEFVVGRPGKGAGSDPSNVVDGPYPVGGIHVPSGVEPIIVGRDAVTAGGYGTVGVVIGPDLNRLAQLRTNNTVTLRRVSLEVAFAERVRERERMQEIVARLS